MSQRLSSVKLRHNLQNKNYLRLEIQNLPEFNVAKKLD